MAGEDHAQEGGVKPRSARLRERGAKEPWAGPRAPSHSVAFLRDHWPPFIYLLAVVKFRDGAIAAGRLDFIVEVTCERALRGRRPCAGQPHSGRGRPTLPHSAVRRPLAHAQEVPVPTRKEA